MNIIFEYSTHKLYCAVYIKNNNKYVLCRQNTDKVLALLVQNSIYCGAKSATYSVINRKRLSEDDEVHITIIGKIADKLSYTEPPDKYDKLLSICNFFNPISICLDNLSCNLLNLPKSLKYIEMWNVVCAGTTKFSDEIIKLKLSCVGMYLATLPAKLQLLHLEHMPMKRLPKLNNVLRELICYSMPLCHFPTNSPPSLKKVMLFNVLLARFTSPPELEYLEIIKSKIDMVPKLPKTLIELNISHNLLTVVENISKLDGLEYLNMSNNAIKYFGKNLPPNCKKLSLAHNYGSWRDNIASHIAAPIPNADKLEYLALSSTDATYCANNMNVYTNLKHLSLYTANCSAIQSYPPLLEELVLVNCDLIKIPRLGKYIKKLVLDTNYIRKIENLPPNLTYLSIHHNDLSDIENLPVHLLRVRLSLNKKIKVLENLPRNITSLDANSCSIEKILNFAPTNIKDLRLQNNKLAAFDLVLNNLITLDISGNLLSYYDSCGRNLVYLYIHDNPLQSITNLSPHLENIRITTDALAYCGAIPIMATIYCQHKKKECVMCEFTIKHFIWQSNFEMIAEILVDYVYRDIIDIIYDYTVDERKIKYM